MFTFNAEVYFIAGRLSLTVLGPAGVGSVVFLPNTLQQCWDE